MSVPTDEDFDTLAAGNVVYRGPGNR